MKYVVPIVEGHGEVDAVPALLHRIAADSGFAGEFLVNTPIRVKSGSFLDDHDHFKKYVTLAADKARQRNGIVLILLDCDDGCPASKGSELLARAATLRLDSNFLIAFAHREFESWFVAGARSLAGSFGLPPDLAPPQNTDSLRDAKGWLGNQMDGGYDPVMHQVEFSRAMDLSQARNNHSFNRLYNKLAGFLSAHDN